MSLGQRCDMCVLIAMTSMETVLGAGKEGRQQLWGAGQAVALPMPTHTLTPIMLTMSKSSNIYGKKRKMLNCVFF